MVFFSELAKPVRLLVQNKRARRRDQAVTTLIGESALHVDLGCGAQPREIGVAQQRIGYDLASNAATGVFKLDLIHQEIPLHDGTVDLVTAFDFLEHIPRVIAEGGNTKFPFVNLMSEVHRVLCVGGFFLSKTPSYPSKRAFQDPTHVNFVTRETFACYFAGPAWARDYGFTGRFEMVWFKRAGSHLEVLLKKLG